MRRSPSGADFPLSPEAQRYYKSGKPWLQRFLPFWAATLVDRMVVLYTLRLHLGLVRKTIDKATANTKAA